VCVCDGVGLLSLSYLEYDILSCSMQYKCRKAFNLDKNVFKTDCNSTGGYCRSYKAAGPIHSITEA